MFLQLKFCIADVILESYIFYWLSFFRWCSLQGLRLVWMKQHLAPESHTGSRFGLLLLQCFDWLSYFWSFGFSDILFTRIWWWGRWVSVKQSWPSSWASSLTHSLPSRSSNSVALAAQLLATSLIKQFFAGWSCRWGGREQRKGFIESDSSISLVAYSPILKTVKQGAGKCHQLCLKDGRNTLWGNWSSL